jgi:hypothetical protein
MGAWMFSRSTLAAAAAVTCLILAPPPAWAQATPPPFTLTPDAGIPGEVTTVLIDAPGAHFEQGQTHAEFGIGTFVGDEGRVGWVTVVSPTQALAQVRITARTALGPRSVTVKTRNEHLFLPNAFNVVDTIGSPALTLLEPNIGQQGQSLTVRVTGQFTHFSPGALVDFGAGIKVGAVMVVSSTVLTAQVTVARTAMAGLRTVTVTSGGETVRLEDAMTVARGPAITAAADRPPNDANWYNADVTVTFTCDDAVSGVAVCPPPTVVTADGANQIISGTMTNSVGVTASTSVSLNVDKTPPNVTLTSPADGSVVFAPDVEATAAANDALSGIAAASCNGSPAVVEVGVIDCVVTLAVGSNAITAAARDAAGNTGTSVLELSYARVPIVTMTSPANLSYLSLSPTTVRGTVDDPTATVTVNGLPAPSSNGEFSITLPIAEGPTIIAAAATSATGAAGTATITVTLDTTPPHVSITSPADAFHTTDDSIAIAGIINDTVVGTINDEQAQVTVNGQPAAVANRTFLRTNVALALGENVIEAVGRDRVGNTVATRITVVRDAATMSRIVTISGNNQTGPIGALLPSPLVVQLVDAAGQPAPASTPVIFKVTQDDGAVSAGAAPAATVIAITDAQGRAEARWTLGHRAGAGSDIAEAYSVGFAGTAIFAASASQGPPGKIVVDTGNDQLGAVGKPLPKPLIAVVVDEGNNRLAEVPVTFEVREGGGSFDGQPNVTVITDSDGRAAATLTLGLQEGNANNIVAASFPENQSFPAGFFASGRVPGNPAATSISGIVLDNNNEPIPGVTVRAVLTSVLNSNRSVIPTVPAVQTDANGQFTIPQAPVGYVELMIDGLTAQRPGVYPALEYDMVTVAGQDNSVGQPIYLLPLSTANQLCVTPTSGGGTLTIAEAPGFSLTFSPGQVTFPGGSQTGCVSVTVVHGDKVPMVPGFGQQPRFIVTIQPSGALFNPPAAITLPNVDGLKPREVTEMYSFDHDIGSFVAIGTGVVSDDGLVIRSSPGAGVLKSGWHCGGNPAVSGTAANCPTCRICDGTSCVPAPGTCDDGKFCTDSDTCANGKCSGTRKPDTAGGTVTQDVDLTSLFGPAQTFVESIFSGGSAPSLSASAEYSRTDVEQCCDNTQSNSTNQEHEISGSIGFQLSVPTPLSFSFPPVSPIVKAGLFVTLGVNGSLTAAWTDDKCLNSLTNTSVTGQISLAIGGQLVIQAGPPEVVDIQGGVSGGPYAQLKGTVGNNVLILDAEWGLTAVTATASIEFLNGTITASFQHELAPAQMLGTSQMTVPF